MTTAIGNNKKLRKLMRRMQTEYSRRNRPDRLEKSLRDELRVWYAKDGECMVQYGIYEDEGQTDDEISALLREELHRDIPGFMFWDCTGIFFTTSIYWQRTPCGIVVIHRMSRDV